MSGKKLGEKTQISISTNARAIRFTLCHCYPVYIESATPRTSVHCLANTGN
jgi:hypothetical protein